MAKILIAVDHKWRDLGGHVYLGQRLEQLGHVVHYARNNQEKNYISTIKPDMVIVNHLIPAKKQKFAKFLQKQNIRVVILPTEGMPTLDGMRKHMGGESCDLSAVDLHFVWNRPMADIVRENPTLADDKVIVAGVPRFDFYKPPLKSILLSKAAFFKKYDLDPRYPLVTFATNFTQASFHTSNQEFYLKNAQKYGRDKVLEELYGDLGDVPKRDHMSRALFLDAFVKLVRQFPEVNFALKLHPTEDHQFYKDLIRNDLSFAADRVRIIAHEYTWDVLNVTDIELNRSCTTAIESWLLGKPTIEMQLNPDEYYYSPEFASGSDMVRSSDELIKKVAYYLAGGAIPQELQQVRDQFLQKWCNLPDGRSTRTVADHLHHLLNNNDRKQSTAENLPIDWRRRINYYLLTLADHFGHDLRVYGLKNTLRRNYVDKLGRYDKYFRDRDIVEWKQRFSRLPDDS
ncbi:MAG: CDP-glycerol glycerophosphotransferase family protein [Gammaproteobacteria bacterium]|nr:CDP-glycerol glycerophosphotransferase family protein [Gammaproteobacteria bacterium]